MRASTATFWLASVLLAGCSAPPPVVMPDREDLGPPALGTMIGVEKEERREWDCTDPRLGVPPSPTRRCASRTLWVAGDMDLDILPVTLSLFAGNVTIGPSYSDEWNLTIVVTADATTDSEAAAEVGRVVVTWSHEAPGGHALSVKVDQGGGACPDCVSVRLSLGIPAAARLSALVETERGDIRVQDLKAHHLAATTHAGTLTVLAQSRNAWLHAGNGTLYALLRPYESGWLTLTSHQAKAELAVPEESASGYAVTARAIGSDATIKLKDGVASGDAAGRTFETHGFNERRFQVRATVVATSGPALVRDANVLSQA